jgi:tRNA-specific 2-thiouridylase
MTTPDEGRLKVLAAMSGGVDSAVAAARAVDAGWDVTGVHLALSRQPATLRTGARGCCSIEDAHDARRAADVLGIPFYVWDFAERFQAEVIEDFVAEYEAGNTPNPCLRCNEKIKFSALLDRALALGFDAVATGHHARLVSGVLSRSVDQAKDQSYVLAVLTREQLAHAIFPLGDSTKEQVRAEAAARSLAVADKPDSHDICFIADGDTQAFLTGRLGERPGDIVDAEGAVVGSHSGAFGFTVGQRRGLRLGTPAPSGEPRYVLSIQPKTNTVVVGSAADLQVCVVRCERPVWTVEEPATGPFECTVQLRAHGMLSPARIQLSEHRARDERAAERSDSQLSEHRARDERGAETATVTATLHTPQRGIAAGQALVMYDGDRVIGSATITSTEREAVGSR